mmetsp:Transcript_80108/g.203822  ORF Transcript_80108/g.203822 Transcript_80108/m.203822 type:complete len:106 (+) Transcript_80108:564-881(+)
MPLNLEAWAAGNSGRLLLSNEIGSICSEPKPLMMMTLGNTAARVCSVGVTIHMKIIAENKARRAPHALRPALMMPRPRTAHNYRQAGQSIVRAPSGTPVDAGTKT